LTMQDKVKGYIAPLYAADITTSTILDSGASELQSFEDNIADVLNQFFVDTATWGLANWESFLGIKTDPSKPDSDRRSVIKAKIRGTGTVTIDLIKNVALSFTNGNVDVTEQNSQYQFTIKFIDALGVPPNLDDFKAAIEEIKPAHLSVIYSFRYLTIAEVEAMTIAQLESTTLDHFAGGGL
jgi:uncharacterized protein YmfQ (DUF2313 family)